VKKAFTASAPTPRGNSFLARPIPKKSMSTASIPFTYVIRVKEKSEKSVILSVQEGTLIAVSKYLTLANVPLTYFSIKEKEFAKRILDLKRLSIWKGLLYMLGHGTRLINFVTITCENIAFRVAGFGCGLTPPLIQSA